MGPDLDAARKDGNVVAQKMLDSLIKEHLTDWTQAAKEGVFVHHGGSTWDKAKADFIKAVEELFVEDEAIGF